MTIEREDEGRGWKAGRGSNERAREHLSTTSRDPLPFQYPLGVEMIEGENYRQREGYEVVYLDDDSPRYQYTIAASADHTVEVFRTLAGLLPGRVRAVLEIPGEMPGIGADGREACEVWLGRPVERSALIHAFDRHERLFVHDGMVGIGAASADGTTELFLDEHKLMYLSVPEMEAADAALAGLRLPTRTVLRHFSELGHIHASLSSKGEGPPYWEVAEELRRTLGLEWEESREYT